MARPRKILSAEVYRRAADIQDQMDSLKAELNRILGGAAVPARAAAAAGAVAGPRKRRKMSPEARARIAAAAKARWAKYRAEKKG
jgi:hypothetical protein